MLEKLEKLTVLLVDDSRSVLARLETAIAEIEGVDVVGTAADGASAIRKVAEIRPDLVLMDIVMPGMDGLAALRVLQANHPEVRVAIVSSLAGTASRAEEAFRLGAVQVIGKPSPPEVLEAFFAREREAILKARAGSSKARAGSSKAGTGS